MFRSNNVTARIFQRQICNPPPGTSVHRARLFYENIVPKYTIYDIQCPDNSLRKFTEDGLYLVSLSKNYQDLVVYRPTYLSFSCKGEDCGNHDLPLKAQKFESFFTQVYSVTLASSGELICKDFFLYMEKNQYGILATSSAPTHDTPAVRGAVQGVPSVEKITFYLLRLQDGFILDKRVFRNDYVNLSHSMGAFLYDDLLSIISLRYQRIHILQIRDSGNLVDVQSIGEFCHEDDELFLTSRIQSKENLDKHKSQQVLTNSDPNSFDTISTPGENLLLSGVKQRLLSYIFRGIYNEETDPTSRMQCLKKKFYFHFQDYADLIIWKVQFLNRNHLLLKFGSVDGGLSRSADSHPSFFAVYNLETTEIVAFYQNSAEELYYLFEMFCNHFHIAGKDSLRMNFITSHSNNIHALEQLRSSKNKASSFTLFAKKMLSSLPFTCQSQSPSPYFDQSLFRYDEKLISATERHRQYNDHPIKFISRRHTNVLKFKIKSGPEGGNNDGQNKKICSFLFHPSLPLVISVQQSFLQPSVVNIHFRR